MEIYDIVKEIERLDEISKGVLFGILDIKGDMGIWRKTIPYVEWPKGWLVKFYSSHQAVLRGIVRLKDDPHRQVSFYLDGYCRLGSVFKNNIEPIPYWEIYNITEPFLQEDYDQPRRYLMNDIDEFLEGIRKMLHGEDKLK